jgi:hypothetical protein
VFPLNLYAHVRFLLPNLHMRPRVQRAPGLPCALCFGEGGTICKTSGAPRRGNAELCLHVIASSAATTASAVARRAKVEAIQLLSLRSKLDCFASARNNGVWLFEIRNRSRPSDTLDGSGPRPMAWTAWYPASDDAVESAKLGRSRGIGLPRLDGPGQNLSPLSGLISPICCRHSGIAGSGTSIACGQWRARGK